MKKDRNNIGELEELVLLIVGVLNDNAYGISVMDELNRQTGRNLSISAIHSVLLRLEKKSFLTSKMGGKTNERGGRRKRYFLLTGQGSSTISKIREQREKLWNLIPDNA